MNAAIQASRRVVFLLSAPEAREVCVCGNFNGWGKKEHCLERKPGGFWEKAIMLQPGRYEYKFRVDGNWFIDPANSQFCDNNFGTQNNVIVV